MIAPCTDTRGGCNHDLCIWIRTKEFIAREKLGHEAEFQRIYEGIMFPRNFRALLCRYGMRDEASK